MATKKKTTARPPHEKPISIPLDFDETLKGLLQTKPEPKGTAQQNARKRKRRA